MSTKPPSAVQESPAGALEKIAYSFVADIPTTEPNDRNRLGYCLWIWMSDRNGTLEQMVRSSGVRTTMPHEEIVKIIRGRVEEFDKKPAA